MNACISFLLLPIFVTIASTSNNFESLQRELDSQIFTQQNFYSSYYKFRRVCQVGRFNQNTFLKYCDAAKEFFAKFPKECLILVKKVRDNYFSAFFFMIISMPPKNYTINSHMENFETADKYRSNEAKGLGELAFKFMIDCKKIAETLWLRPITRGDEKGHIERVESIEIFLWIMKRFSNEIKEKPDGLILYDSYKSLSFVFRNLEFNADYIPSYEGFLKTFKSLRILSLEHKGNLPDDPAVTNLLSLFGFYSRLFLYNYLEELPTTVPPLLLFLVTDQGMNIDEYLFDLFSQSSLDGLHIAFGFWPRTDLANKVVPIFFSRKKKNPPSMQFLENSFRRHEAESLAGSKGFDIFLYDLIISDPEDILNLEAKKDPPITLTLSEWEKWFIKVFLRLKSKNHSYRLYQSDYLKDIPTDSK